MEKVNVKIQREQIIEAVFSKFSFEKLLQHQVNLELLLEGKDCKVELAENTYYQGEITELKFKISKSDKNLSIEPPELFLGDIVTEPAVRRIISSHKKYDQLLLDRERKLSLLLSFLPNIRKIIKEDQFALVNYSEHCLCKLLGSTGIDHDLPKFNINFGFHFIETKNNHSYLKYYSTSGWKLNRLVSQKLEILKKEFSPNDSNVEFILKLVLILSQLYSRSEKLTIGNTINQTTALDLMDLRQPLENLIQEIIFKSSEREKWVTVFQKMKSLDAKTDFESLLRNMMLIGHWCQVTSIGHFISLLKKGEQIITNRFEMSADINTNDEIDIWNYTVITTIEEFFLSNSRFTNLFSQDSIKPNVFLIAKPIFFEGTVLGDFFISGTYGIKSTVKNINSAIKKTIIPALPFIQREIEQLLRHIFTINMLRTTAITFNYSNNDSDVTRWVDRFGDNLFWSLVNETFDPVKKLVEEKEWGNVIQQMRHNIITHLAYLPLSTNEEERSWIVDDIIEYLQLTRYMSTDKELKKYIDERCQVERREVLLLKDVIIPIVEMILSIIEKNPQILRGRNSIQKSLVENKDAFLTFDRSQADFKIVAPISISRLIFKDLITNAVKNVNDEAPKCKIEIRHQKDFVEVVIQNNSSINQNYYDQLDSESSLLPKEPGHWGIYICKRLSKHLGWKLKPDPDSVNEELQQTTLKIRIPTA